MKMKSAVCCVCPFTPSPQRPDLTAAWRKKKENGEDSVRCEKQWARLWEEEKCEEEWKQTKSWEELHTYCFSGVFSHNNGAVQWSRCFWLKQWCWTSGGISIAPPSHPIMCWRCCGVDKWTGRHKERQRKTHVRRQLRPRHSRPQSDATVNFGLVSHQTGSPGQKVNLSEWHRTN